MPEEPKKKNVVIETAKQKATDKVVKKVTEQAVQKAVTAASSIGGPAGVVAGHAVGKIASDITSKAVELANKAKKPIGDFLKGAAIAPFAIGGLILGSLTAGVAALGAVAVGTFIVAPLVIAFFLLIINNSAYMVPPSTTNFATRIVDYGATCPIPDGVIFIGIYGTQLTPFGHGENAYWDSLRRQCSSYPLSGCYAKQSGDYCYNRRPTCSTYGLAIDVRYPTGGSAGKNAYLPYIKGESSTWERASGHQCNCAGTLRTVVDGDVYEMYISHINSLPRGGESGDVLGTINEDAHIHIELKINGQWVSPESMCSGAGGSFVPGAGNESEDEDEEETTDSRRSCSAAGGNCFDAPSCGRVNRTAVNGRCFNSTEICCTKDPTTTETANCESAGGTCYDPAALSLLNPGLGSVEKCEDVTNYQTISGACASNQLCCKAP